MGWNQHRRVRNMIRNGTLTGRRMIIPDRIELVWWRTFEAETIQRMELPECSPDLNKCLGHAPTTHCCATKAACYCPRLGDCTSGVEQYSPKADR
ncbi:hypothetical protein TNCV_3618031 [Trichonephila clavipes]|nr:hypothetical protein TNCV_3618031 [Trichonephila clavipes]